VALISPILDDRTYEQLRDELVRRIPTYAPEWTNHNESDPGIALLELFAYLGESLLYRFNQIPDSTKVAFLQLLGVTPRTARPAQALVAVDTDQPAGVAIPRGSEAKAGSISFSAVGDVHAWPLECVAVGKTYAPTATTRAESDRRYDAWRRLSLGLLEKVTFYETTVVPDDPLAQDAVVLDVSASVDQCLWVALLSKDTTQLAKLSNRSVFLGIALDAPVDPYFNLEDLADPRNPEHADTYHSASLLADPPPMLWRLWNGPAARTKDGNDTFTSLEIGSDTTRGITATGVVEVILPEKLPTIGDPLDPTLGSGQSPPPLPDEKEAARVVAWLQVSRPASNHVNDVIGKISWVGVNVVEVRQFRKATPELLGTGTGDSDQRYPLAHNSVLPGTVQLQVQDLDDWIDWNEVEPYTISGPDDRTFTLDAAAGSVSFTGYHVPQPAQQIRVLTYQYCAGAGGNVAAGAISAINGPGPFKKVANPLPAAGGANAASLTAALDEIPATVHRRERAVIAKDFADFAVEVDGVGRAEPLPRLHPDTPDTDAAGVVSVVVFPEIDLTTPNAPQPDFALLRRVAGYLDERRLLTTELYVIPPTYLPVAVSVGLAIKPGYQVDAVRQWVELILRQYLAPLPPYGPDGGGWPVERTVRGAELEAVAVQVEGVDYLTGLTLWTPDSSAPTGYRAIDQMPMKRWQFPELIDIKVVSGDPLPPDKPYEPSPPDRTLVPLPSDVC
jgi:predicted phage baseplate assembly protein